MTVLGGYLADVRGSLTALRSSAGTGMRTAIDNVGESIDALQTAIDEGGVSGIVSATRDLVNTGQTLLDQLSEGCPSVSSSIPAVVAARLIAPIWAR